MWKYSNRLCFRVTEKCKDDNWCLACLSCYDTGNHVAPHNCTHNAANVAMIFVHHANSSIESEIGFLAYNFLVKMSRFATKPVRHIQRKLNWRRWRVSIDWLCSRLGSWEKILFIDLLIIFSSEALLHGKKRNFQYNHVDFPDQVSVDRSLQRNTQNQVKHSPRYIQVLHCVGP